MIIIMNVISKPHEIIIIIIINQYIFFLNLSHIILLNALQHGNQYIILNNIQI